MLDYLQKFQTLDNDLRQAVSSPEAVKRLTELEKEYQVVLSQLVIRIMVKDIALSAVPSFLISELHMDLSKADELYQKMRQSIFNGVIGYLENRSSTVDNKAAESIKAELEKPVTGTQFMIDAEDEEEVAKYKSAPIEEKGPDWEGAADKIIRLAKMTFSSELLNDRLKTILVTYLKGIRNRVDTKLFLQKSASDGGLELDEKTADQLFSLAQEFVIKPDLAPNKPKFKLPEDALLNRDVPYDFTREMERLNKDKKEKENTGVVDPYAWGRQKETVGKVKMNDVKVSPPKIMNQLDELRFIDLVIFRRLASQPEEAVAKIKEKIELLEFENYRKKLDGISAWRQSPVNRNYLSICEIAATENKSVGDVIEAFKNKGMACLSPAEFIAIMKLNKELRY